MTLLETVTDAFLEALEEGATPPRRFAVRLTAEAWCAIPVTGFEIAGYRVELQHDGPEVFEWH